MPKTMVYLVALTLAIMGHIAAAIDKSTIESTIKKICPKKTHGTCHLFGCDESRGPTKCLNHECHCKKGYCASDDGERCETALEKAEEELLDLWNWAKTPKRVQYMVAGALVVFGIGHTLPGTLKMQSKMMAMPIWFLVCAGLLMASSGVLYYKRPVIGLNGVSFCMGGALITGALMPGPMIQKLASMVFSMSFLAIAIWANYHEEDFHHEEGPLKRQIGLLMVAYIVGALGRLLFLKFTLLLRFLAFIGVIKTDSRAKSFVNCPEEKKGIVSQCTKCGNIFVQDSLFCRKCGHPRPKIFLWISANDYVVGHTIVENEKSAAEPEKKAEVKSTPAADTKKGQDAQPVRKRRVDSPRS